MKASLGLLMFAAVLTAAPCSQGFGQIANPGSSGAIQPRLGLPQREYRHETRPGRVGVFRLDGDRGTASYWFNNRKHDDTLQFDKVRTIEGRLGWSYRVVRDGRPINFWFFFAADSHGQVNQRSVYKMYYSLIPDDWTGKKPWIRILAPGGTTVTPLQPVVPRQPQ